ncbi:MAG TPA: MXAN_6577-like cysteine-rich protein [Anaeromyxobacter sp.]
MRSLLAVLAILSLASCSKELLCPQGETACGGRCVSLATDTANCGSCGRSVGRLEVCSAGVATCAPGIALCGGVCTDLSRDAANCGSCANTCASTDFCTASSATCTSTCAADACDRSCVDRQTDRYNCGSCGHACAAGETCRGGACHADLAVACYATNEVVPVATDLTPAGAHRPTPSGPDALTVLGSAIYAANGYPQASVSILPLDPVFAATAVNLSGSDLEHITAWQNVLLVTNASVGTLVVMSPGGAVLEELPMPDQTFGPNPHGIDVAGGVAYVALYGSSASGDVTAGQALAKVDLSTLPACVAGTGPCGSVEAKMPLVGVTGAADASGRPFPSEVLATAGRVYVTLANLALGDNPWDATYYVKPAGHGRLAVVTPAGPGAADDLTVVDLGTSCGNPGALAVDGTTLWVACGSFGYPSLAPPVLLPLSLTSYPPVVGTPLSVPGIVPGKIAFCGSGGYVTDQASGAVVQFDPATRTVYPSVVVCPTSPGPYGYAWAADVACAP